MCGGLICLFVFEDNPNAALSKIIKTCYNGENIEFSNSNSRLYKKIRLIEKK